MPEGTVSSGTCILLQESVDDLLLGLCLCESQGHELDDLLAGDLADGSLVDKGSLGTVGLEGGDSEDAAFIHDDGVAFGVAAAGGVSEDAHVKLLVGLVTGNGTGHDVGAGAVAVEGDVVDAVGILGAVCHEAFVHEDARRP